MINETDVRALPGIGRREAIELAAAENAAFIAELKALPPAAWDGITDCDPWTVKDVAAHVLGWGELAMSWSEFRHQMAAALRGWRSNPVHAQNALQVEERAHLSPEDVVTRLEIALPALLRLRRRLSLPGRLVPFYNPLLGVTTLGFVADMIFTRDVLAHRIDVSISAGTEISVGPHDQRVLGDCIRHWTRITRASLRFELADPLGGNFVTADDPIATVRGTGMDIIRVFSGRLEPASLEIEGDREQALAWLGVPCPF